MKRRNRMEGVVVEKRRKAEVIELGDMMRAPAERAQRVLAPGDELAIWPPVAGG